MKKVVIVIAVAMLLANFMVSCDDDQAQEQTELYGIDKEEIKETDV